MRESNISMKKIRLLEAGFVPAVRSQTIYHAVAYSMLKESPDTIILVSPADPYVCIGFHQNLEKEVDLDYCRQNSLPVYRREVGGGAVLLDHNQLFSQWVFHPESLSSSVEERFRLYSQPLVETYKELGIPAYLRPINDIHVDGKKIGGTGAAQIGEAEVLVGSFMFDFDKVAMTHVLKVSSEKMRDKIFESLEQYMTTIKELVDELPAREKVIGIYLEKCAEILHADIVPGKLSDAEEDMAAKLDDLFKSEDWLLQKSQRLQHGIKIHEDVAVVESALKAPGGLIRVTARLKGRRIDALVFSGDFTMMPNSALAKLEASLTGLEIDPDALQKKTDEFYRDEAVQSPGVEPGDFVQIILQAAGYSWT